MALIGFVNIEPASGSGVQAVSVSAAPHTGRLQRSQTVEASATGAAEKKQLVVNQAGTEENVKVTSATATVEKGGGSVTITGTSNSSKLSFTLTQAEENPLVITLPDNYLANSVDTANNAEIAGDPGAANEYNWSITITDIPANETINELSTTLTVTAAGAQSATVTIKQTEGDPYIELDKTEINLVTEGTAQTVNVDSNTTWSFSEVVSEMVLKTMRAMRLKK